MSTFHEHLWATDFITLDPMAAFPQARRISEELVLDPHYHFPGINRPDRHCLFQFTLNGSTHFKDQTGDYAIPAGQGFLCLAHDPNITYYHHPEATEPLHLIYFVFFGPTAEAMVTDWVSRHGHRFSLPIDSGYIKSLKSWQNNLSSQLTVDAMQGQALVTQLFTALSEAQQDRIDHGHIICRKVVDDMRQHLAEPWTVARFAERAGISREHLTRLFQHHLHTSPYRLQRSLRLESAARALVSNHAPISEVARAVGLDNAAHFSRLFKQHLGMTPGQCRRSGFLPLVPHR